MAILLFCGAYGAVVVLTTYTLTRVTSGDRDDRRLVLAVVVSLPLIGVRLAYSILSIFDHSSDFGLLTGKVVIWVFMAVLEEFAVVGIYLLAGYLAPVLAHRQQGSSNSRIKYGGSAGQGQTQNTQGAPAPRPIGFKRSRGLLVGNLIGMASDAAANAKDARAARSANRDVEAGR